MSDDSVTANELANQVFEYELRAGAAAEDLFGNVDQQKAEEVMIEEFEKMVNKTDDPQMLQSVVMTMAQIGRGVGSQKMVNAAEQVIQQSEALDSQ